ncbi:MAG: RNA-binding S4 domain-containing protein [Desulfobulbaceae bacterium]|nr:MAG: RNA-binding S4 domain-containing protein [Desulfobulbaceae bacterium]
MDTAKAVTITKYPIRLGQFLKLSDLVSDGLEAKFLITEGLISVNGIIVFERGKQLKKGDVITYKETSFRCA